MRLSTLGLQAGQKLRYTYDFGDDWIHEIVLEKQLDTDPAEGLPWCTGGAGACPPEDCGGPYGYAELLKVLTDPKHPEHTEMLDWAGGPIDPNEFSVDEVNAELRGEGLEEDEPDGGHPLNGVDLKALVRLTQMMLERRGGQPKAIERVDAPERILQLRVTLTAEDPPVWRQVLVSSHTSLYGLHEVIQELFEWDDEHMHGFARGTKRSRPDWTELDPEEIDEDEIGEIVHPANDPEITGIDATGSGDVSEKAGPRTGDAKQQRAGQHRQQTGENPACEGAAVQSWARLRCAVHG